MKRVELTLFTLVHPTKTVPKLGRKGEQLFDIVQGQEIPQRKPAQVICYAKDVEKYLAEGYEHVDENGKTEYRFLADKVADWIEGKVERVTEKLTEEEQKEESDTDALIRRMNTCTKEELAELADELELDVNTRQKKADLLSDMVDAVRGAEDKEE